MARHISRDRAPEQRRPIIINPRPHTELHHKLLPSLYIARALEYGLIRRLLGCSAAGSETEEEN